jgi:hypothetical protein
MRTTFTRRQFEKLHALHELFEESSLAIIETNAALTLLNRVLPGIVRHLRHEPDRDRAVAIRNALERTLENRNRLEMELLTERTNQAEFTTQIVDLYEVDVSRSEESPT